MARARGTRRLRPVALFGRLSMFLIGTLISLFSSAVSGAGDDGNTTTVEMYQGGTIRVTTEFPHDYKVKCVSWILFPSELVWSPGIRAFLYLFALLFVFLGIAIISDVFMSAIEKITSSEKVVVLGKGTANERTLTVLVWNETVANLSLMALGSSAPEILLSVIETVSNLGAPPGELGPGTIVGSAAFNLLVISAVCVTAIPADSIKKINQFGVFVITASSSVFAYVWIFIVLGVWTPDEVTIAEAIITFAMFPLLVICAFLQDISCKLDMESRITSARFGEPDGGADCFSNEKRELLQQTIDQVRLEGGAQDADDMAKRVDQAMGSRPQQLPRAVYKINAIRGLVGRRRVIALGDKEKKEMPPAFNPLTLNTALHRPSMSANGEPHDNEGGMNGPSDGDCTINFAARYYSVMENGGPVYLHLERTGNVERKVTVYFHTEADTAVPGENYRESSGTVVFPPNVKTATIDVPIIDNVQYQPDRCFDVLITFPTGGATLGSALRARVLIIDDDIPGILFFRDNIVRVKESAGHAIVYVVREHGSSGIVSIEYETSNGTAQHGKDFTATTGRLHFDHNEVEKCIMIPIKDDKAYEKDEYFYISMSQPQGGATIREGRDKCQVIVNSDDDVRLLVEKVMEKMAEKQNHWHSRIETHTWAQQFRDAMSPVGDPTEEDYEPPSHLDYFMHFITFFWKVLFSAVPPTDYAGGWAAFFAALGFIGMITAIVAELAGLFGCVVGLKDSVTAITFVALGTSLPDMFASKQACLGEEYADAAIGNVTGSNSVNVFLGLGLPWLIAVFYYHSKGEKYSVPAGNLAFSVAVFSICAVIAILMFFGKRFIPGLGGGELGGPGRTPMGVALVCLWFTYVLLSSLQAYGHI